MTLTPRAFHEILTAGSLVLAAAFVCAAVCYCVYRNTKR